MCGLSLCVEVKHLKFKTPVENAKDKIAHGRHAKSDLTFENVCEIRKLYAKGDITQKALAKKYNISVSHISGIINLKKRIEG